MMYRLAPDVFYRLYDGNTILYKTGMQKVCIFNATAKEILDCFAEFSTLESCFEILKAKYELAPEASNEISSFIDQLVKLKILLKENTLLESRDSAELYFQDNLLPMHQLYSVMFELTFRCNEKCRHCYCVNDDKDELTTDEIKRILDEFYTLNVFEVIFTGGDLFVRSDAFEILEYAYSKNFLITVFTNGIALSDADILKLKSYHLKSIHFSIYSHIPERHDSFTQVPGSFYKTVDVMKKCALVGLPVNIKTVAMEYNFDDIEGIMTLAKNIGATVQVGMSVNAKNDGDLTPIQFRIDSVERYAKVIQTVSKNIEFRCNGEKAIPRQISDRLCGAGNNDLSINAYGDVHPCNALLINCGNVRKQSIKQIWENSPALNEIRSYTFERLKGCDNCPDLAYCNFCPGGANAETGDPLMRYDEACKISKAKILAENCERR